MSTSPLAWLLCLALTTVVALPRFAHSHAPSHGSSAFGVFTPVEDQKNLDGTLAGAVSLACSSGSRDCNERPYQVPLMLWAQNGQHPPHRLDVSADGEFSAPLPAGTYLISSGDARSSCCLPTLSPETVTIAPGQVTRVNLRFQPGLSLPIKGR